MIATRTDPELRDLFSKIDQFEMLFFNNNSTAQLVMHVIKKGSLQV
jgi:TAG lipase/steryl ester hydrolase/phospholipase A2/LPA acyltransferase